MYNSSHPTTPRKRAHAYTRKQVRARRPILSEDPPATMSEICSRTRELTDCTPRRLRPHSWERCVSAVVRISKFGGENSHIACATLHLQVQSCKVATLQSCKSCKKLQKVAKSCKSCKDCRAAAVEIKARLGKTDIMTIIAALPLFLTR